MWGYRSGAFFIACPWCKRSKRIIDIVRHRRAASRKPLLMQLMQLAVEPHCTPRNSCCQSHRVVLKRLVASLSRSQHCLGRSQDFLASWNSAVILTHNFVGRSDGSLIFCMLLCFGLEIMWLRICTWIECWKCLFGVLVQDKTRGHKTIFQIRPFETSKRQGKVRLALFFLYFTLHS